MRRVNKTARITGAGIHFKHGRIENRQKTKRISKLAHDENVGGGDDGAEGEAGPIEPLCFVEDVFEDGLGPD